MKWFIRLIGLLILALIGAVITGFVLPAHTEHTRTITLKQTPDAVFAALADVQKMPEWNRNLEKVELLSPINGKEATKQTFKGGMTMTIVTTENLPPTHLVRAMRDVSGPFVGSWTYEISPVADGCTVVLKEKSEVNNPIFRVMMLIFGQTKYMDEHLTDLAKHLGESAKVR